MLYPIQNEFRNKLDLSGIWDFQADPDETGEANGWALALPHPRPMAVPASWNEQYADLFNYFGLGWYQQRAYIPASWQGQRIFIRVGSANYFGSVYLNGQLVGAHEGGHLPFEFEVSQHIRWGAENVIAIRVENHLKPTRVPSAGMGGGVEDLGLASGFPSATFDFFPYAGLHRPVVLYTVPQVHIQDLTVVTGIEGEDGWVQVSARLRAAAAEGTLALSGGEVRIESEFDFQDGQAQATLHVANARLWSPQDPYLYDLTLQTATDRYTLKVGIRTIEVQGGQILLNGQPVQLNGFARHEDFYASGKGLNLALMVKDYQLMRWAGAVSFRTSHYPYAEEDLMMADRQGFLVIDETPAVSLQFDNQANMAERYRMCLQQIDEMIARDKNHPCVVMWSVANEPHPPDMMGRYTGGEVDEDLEKASVDFLHGMVAHARKLDPTRLVTLVGMMGSPTAWQETCDVACINRYWGWYVGGGQLARSFAMLEQELDDLWERWGMPIIITEFGADTQAGLHGHPAVMWTEEYQAEFLRGYLEIAARKDFVAGMQVWNFADFRAVQSVMRVGGMNLKGVFTRAREPKLAAHVLREFWVADAVPASPREEAAPGESLPAGNQAQNAPQALNPGVDSPQSTLEALAQRINGVKPGLTTTLLFDLYQEGVYRLVIKNGACHIEAGEGEATASMELEWEDAQKLFSGALNPMVAIMTGRIKTGGDARAFLALQDFFSG